jgi:hypothetical protein
LILLLFLASVLKDANTGFKNLPVARAFRPATGLTPLKGFTTGKCTSGLSKLPQVDYFNEMPPTKTPERIYSYTIDREGRLWIEGTELTDSQVLKFFMKNLERLPEGKFRVLCMGETNLIEAEDVPYVVQAIHIGKDKIELIFPGDYREALDPNTLRVGRDNVLYCQIRQGAFTARFNRKPYLELTRLVDRDRGKKFVLNWQGKKYPIEGA